MKMKNKKIFKGLTAIVLCVVLIVTSLPLVVFAAGTYNPVPYFPTVEEGRRYAAYKNSNGGITVTFPSASANTERKAKTVTGYLVELADMGPKDQLHTDTVIFSKTVAAMSGQSSYEAEITANELHTISGLENGLLSDRSYNISITAYDNEGWFSETLNTVVSNIPVFMLSDPIEPLVTSGTAARIMEDMSGATNSQSTDGNSNNGIDYKITGNAGALQVIGRYQQTGMEDSSGKDTYGYGFTVRQLTNGATQGFLTSYSRQTWDFSGAEEVWFWLDLSQVDLQGLAFQLIANEKQWIGWADGSELYGQNDSYTDHIFSTTGYQGSDAYCRLLQTDGTWKKFNMPDGTIDLGHYRGYVRVPIEFFCATEDIYIALSNQDFGRDKGGSGDLDTGGNISNKGYNREKTLERVRQFVSANWQYNPSVLVTAAGTPINQALLLQRRSLRGNWSTGAVWVTTTHQFDFNNAGEFPDLEGGYMLAAGLTDSEVRNNNLAGNGKRAYIENGQVMNRENAYKAIEDMYAIGFSYTGVSEDSLDKSFFLDNVVFYRTDGGQYSSNTLNGNASTGEPIANYYDQTVEIPRAIFNACNQYFDDNPNWGDYRAVNYIEEMIEAYKNGFAGTSTGNGFLSEANLTAMAARLNMDSAWNNFLEARQACIDAGTYGSDNNEATDLIGPLVSEIEKLPDVSEAMTITQETQDLIKHIWQVYDQLSLDQLDMLGLRNEYKLLEYYKYMASALRNNTVPVGDRLASTPYIMFNDFESYTLGTRAYQLENDANAGNSAGATGESAADYRFTKSLVTYTANAFDDFNGHKDDNNTRSLNFDIPTDTLRNNITKSDFRIYPFWATVDGNGFMGTNGLTATIDSQYYSEGEGEYNAVSFTRMGAESDAVTLRGYNAGLDSLGDFASTNITVKNGANPPICLVFYVDFSELSNFRISAAIHAYVDGEYEDFSLDMGDSSDNRAFWLLSPTTGEWVKCTNTKRMYTLTSDVGGELKLDNYRGYIMIPLEFFRSGYRGAVGWGYDYALSEEANALNGIYRIQIGVAPLDSNNSDGNAAAAGLDGRNFTIDNVGFSYDPIAYASVVASRKAKGIVDINFDEMTDSKSTSAYKFGELVMSIDPYDDTTFANLVAEARTIYDGLTAFQKTHESVKNAYSILERYEKWINGTEPKPMPEMTVADIKATVAALPNQITGRDGRDPIRGEYDLPYPYNIDTDSIDYSQYGLSGDTDEIQAILDLYNNSVARLSPTQKAELGDAYEQVVHAYEAATRLRLLELAYNDATAVHDAFETLYIDPDEDGAGDTFISVEEYDDVKSLWEQYTDLTFYSKYMLENMNGTMELQEETVVITLKRLLRNIAETTTTSGVTLTGGVLQLINTYKELYESTRSKLSGYAQTVDLATLKAEYEEYNSLVPAYYSILELYNIWYEEDDNYSMWDTSGSYPKWNESSASDGFADGILALFPVNVTGLNGDADLDEVTLSLTSENYSSGVSATYNVIYSVYLPWIEGSDVKYVTLESENGKMVLSDTNQEAEYKVSVSGGATVNTTSANLTTATKLNDVANNAYTKNGPLNFEVKVSFDEEPDVQLPVSDKLILRFYHEDGTEIEELRKTINVTYTPDDNYEVYIPAEFPIDWDYEDSTDVSYEVVTYLSEGASLDVSVAQANGATPNVLVNAATGDTLPITTANFGTQNFTGVITEKTSPNPAPTLTVTDWSKPIDKYETQLTYTVSFNPANP